MADAVKGVYDLVNSEKKKESSSIEPKEFFWDQFIKYIASAILALSVLNVTVEFLRGGGVSCFPPSDNVGITAQDLEGRMLYEFGRGQTSYINNYCARNVPNTEYFPIYILIHGLLLIVPHYIWNALHNGDFDSFFLIVDKLDRLRDSTTGEYDTNNFDRVTKLEQEYSGRNIYYSYILKLVLQLLIVCGSVMLSALYFKNFSFIFFCPGDSVDDFTCPEEHSNIGTPCGWPLNVTVPCVYTSLRVLNLVRYADFFLLAIAAGLVLYGLGWCVVRHTEQLGFFELAKFSFQSCLKPDHFVFPPVVSWPTYPCFTTKKNDPEWALWIERLWPVTHYPQFHVKQIFSPGILHDLDFLLLMLFRADTSHGQVFKDLQTIKELKGIVGRDHQLLHLFINTQQDLSKSSPSNDFYNKFKKSKPQEDSPGCCSCFTRLFRGRNRNRDGTTSTLEEEPGSTSGQSNHSSQQTLPGSSQQDEEQTATNGKNKQPQFELQAVKERKSLHKIFLQSDFNVGAEWMAYQHYKPHLGCIEYLGEYMKGIRDVLFWFAANFVPEYQFPGSEKTEKRNYFAMDISFGSIGYSLILARPFVKVMSVNLQPHYQNTSDMPGIFSQFHTNYATFKFPSSLYSQSSESVTGAQTMLLQWIDELPKGPKTPIHTLDFIVVGPITEESKLVSVHLLLNMLSNRKHITKEGILLAIRPLKIGMKKVHRRFFKYEPSQSMFKLLEYYKELKDASFKHTVDGLPGIKVPCGSTPCVFEMIAYQYISNKEDQEDDKSILFSPVQRSHATDQASGDTQQAIVEESEQITVMTPDSGVPTSPRSIFPVTESRPRVDNDKNKKAKSTAV
ncbi:uncharacterized protein LOC135346000 isoform X2 [Halichondria panicea]|uniref:uncharacterized protein LOC135346000 isoform X2 n=1 Tax=Halichondria panicea TaxID=6063 RepID=UPI00312B3597